MLESERKKQNLKSRKNGNRRVYTVDWDDNNNKQTTMIYLLGWHEEELDRAGARELIRELSG